MVARNVYHVVPDGDNWSVKKEGSSLALQTFPHKDDAVEAGRKIAKDNAPSQLIVHKADGTIEYEHTYDSDPFPPKG